MQIEMCFPSSFRHILNNQVMKLKLHILIIQDLWLGVPITIFDRSISCCAYHSLSYCEFGLKLHCEFVVCTIWIMFSHSAIADLYINNIWTNQITWESIFVSARHYSGVKMSVVALQITGVSSVCLIVCSGADQWKRQSSASLAFVRGIHRCPVDPHTKGQ